MAESRLDCSRVPQARVRIVEWSDSSAMAYVMVAWLVPVLLVGGVVGTCLGGGGNRFGDVLNLFAVAAIGMAGSCVLLPVHLWVRRRLPRRYARALMGPIVIHAAILFGGTAVCALAMSVWIRTSMV